MISIIIIHDLRYILNRVNIYLFTILTYYTN